MAEMRGLIEQIGLKYKKLKGGDRHWGNEEARVKDLIDAIGQQIQDRYTFGEAIGVGGGGIVVKVNDKNLGAVYALKMPRPVEGREQLMGIIMEREISRLLVARHDNIVSVFYKDEVELSGQRWPFYIMEYIDGATDAVGYLDREAYDYRSLIRILDQAVKGLAFLHSQRIIHGDVKFENILVSPDGKAKISDLGSARALDQEIGGHTTLFVTKDWAHPEILRRADVTNASESNRMRAEIDRSTLRPAFDLYPLGKNLLHILAREHSSDRMPPYYRNYLELMGCRLLDGQNHDGERSFLNLTTRTLGQIKYDSVEQVSADLAKVTGQYTLHDAVPELNHHYPQTVQISSSGATSFTERVSRLLSLPYFRRLAAVSQLGLIVQIYPSASHSRLEHMLGTYANAAKYCDALWNDPLNPLFKQIMTEHDINLVLVTALCHDIGQYPLAHDFGGIKGVRYFFRVRFDL